MEGREALLARQPSAASPQMKSESTRGTILNDQQDAKNVPSNSTRYKSLFGTEFVFMNEDDERPTEVSKAPCQRLLEAERPMPRDSGFSDDVLRQTCRRLLAANEAKMIDKISRLTFPSVEDLADSGAKHLSHVVESVNNGWTGCIPILQPRPQPDYSVGLGLPAFWDALFGYKLTIKSGLRAIGGIRAALSRQ